MNLRSLHKRMIWVPQQQQDHRPETEPTGLVNGIGFLYKSPLTSSTHLQSICKLGGCAPEYLNYSMVPFLYGAGILILTLPLYYIVIVIVIDVAVQ